MCSNDDFASLGDMSKPGEEIEDIASEYHIKLKRGSFLPTNETQKKKLTEYMMEMYNYDGDKPYDKLMLTISKKYKFHPKRNKLSYIYRTAVYEGKIEPNDKLEHFLITKKMRSQSGVIVVAVIMAPGQFSCSQDCHYCPNFPGISRSYIPDEPTVERGKRNKFDAHLQFMERITAYFINGHPIDKIELIIKGGTFSCYPREYQKEFMRDLYYAANTTFDDMPKRDRLSLAEEITLNESSLVGIIGMTIETRPDFITRQEMERLRSYGVTRVEMGVQHTDNKILELINRDHTIEDTKRAIKMLKDNCFKVDIHLMPDLPGSSYEQDVAMFDEVLNSDDLHADQWKIYPTEVTEYTKIKEWYDNTNRSALIIQRHVRGHFSRFNQYCIKNEINWKYPQIREFSKWDYERFKKNYAWYYRIMPNPNMFIYIPYTEDKEKLMELAIYVKTRIQRDKRINRFIRDFPETLILGGNPYTNFRQLIHDKLKEKGEMCRCIRCREVKDNNTKLSQARMTRQDFKSSDGEEIFLSYTSCKHNIYSYDICWKWILFCIISWFFNVFVRILGIQLFTGKKYELSWYGCGSEDVIYGFLRLRHTKSSGKVYKYSSWKNKETEFKAFPELENCGLIRELHVYGDVVTHYNKKKKNVSQHSGFGRKLIKEAERLSQNVGFEKMAVISGIGVRNYYRKFGYELPYDKIKNKDYKGGFLGKQM